ncbi:MAG TPA: hypothetical protein VE981_11865, partial [Planctomycetota bacterium]|nr:hypothetical protein [Planctomycetota bacterium]
SKDPEGRPGSPDEIIDAIQGIRRRRQRARAPRPLLRVLWTRTLRAGRRTWSSRRSLTLRGAAILVILMLVLPAALGVTGLVEEMRRKESESPARKAYDLAITIGDFDSALRVAQETYGRQSKEYREAERLQKETGLLDKERNARDCMASEDWDGASSWYQLLESGSTALEQRRFAQARSYCQTLARARRFEREGSPESALAVYLSLLALGTPYEKYLRERIDALERRKP